jgi:hypothetical protein
MKYLLISLSLCILTGCFQERLVEGGFLGTFVGYVLPADGFPVPLRIETRLLEKEERHYTFSGEAQLGEVRYRIEGSEQSQGGVRFMHTPPNGGVMATLFDEDDRPIYGLNLRISYHEFEPKIFHGSLLHEDTYFGTVELQRHIAAQRH